MTETHEAPLQRPLRALHLRKALRSSYSCVRTASSPLAACGSRAGSCVRTTRTPAPATHFPVVGQHLLDHRSFRSRTGVRSAERCRA